METENKIIKAFIEGYEDLTIRQLSKTINADYKITYVALQKLIKDKIITAKKIGKSTVCNLNHSIYNIKIHQVQDKRRKEILRNKDLNQLHKEINRKLNTSLYISLLFGSFVNKKQNKNSDIDLLFISNENEFEKKINTILSLVPLKVHSLVFTEEEFIKMATSNKLNVVKEIIQKNIIMYGIENYYNLLKKCLMT